MKKLKYHIFICTNERLPGHPRGCCMEKGSSDLVQRFKLEVAKAGLAPVVRAQKAGCLDTCEHGPSVVIYPEGIWYGGVTQDDIQEIVHSHLLNGKPVKPLMIPGKHEKTSEASD